MLQPRIYLADLVLDQLTHHLFGSRTGHDLLRRLVSLLLVALVMVLTLLLFGLFVLTAAQLAKLVVAPRVDVTLRVKCQGMVSSSSNGDDEGLAALIGERYLRQIAL